MKKNASPFLGAIGLFLAIASTTWSQITINSPSGPQVLLPNETILVTGTGSISGGAVGITGPSNNQATINAGGLVSGTSEGILFTSGGVIANSGTIGGGVSSVS